MRFIVAAFALAACYSPTYRDCEISCLGGTCPSGLLCDQQVCRTEGFSGACGGGDGGPDALGDDPDGDGVLGTADNCPAVSNLDQADEDGDGLGDLCDPCPPFGTATDNMDSDGDGVGDGCDPSPMVGANNQVIVDKIEVFAGFASATLPGTGSTVPAASWQLGNGKAIVLDKGTTAPATLTWPLPVAASMIAVLAHVTPNGTGTLRPAGAGVITQMPPDSSTGVVCWVGVDNNQPQGGLELFGLNNPTLPPLYSPDPFNTSTTYSPDLTTRNGVFNCSEKHATGMLSSQGNVSGTRIGVVAEAVDATFDWVMIVSEQATP